MRKVLPAGKSNACFVAQKIYVSLAFISRLPADQTKDTILTFSSLLEGLFEDMWDACWKTWGLVCYLAWLCLYNVSYQTRETVVFIICCWEKAALRLSDKERIWFCLLKYILLRQFNWCYLNVFHFWWRQAVTFKTVHLLWYILFQCYTALNYIVYKNCLFLFHKFQQAWQTHDWPAKSVFCLCCTTIFCLARGHMDLCKAVILVHQPLWRALWDHCRSCSELATGHPR